jgi:putative transposase
VRVGKDAVSRIARRLEEQQREWRERPLEEKDYPYLYQDATYLKVRWGARGTRNEFERKEASHMSISLPR